jgi:two-component system chemotaxis response regulator CheB
VIGVILSGTLDDGTVGLRAIKSAGGLAVVQDPEQASYPGMPKSALEHVEVDHVAPAAELGGLLTRLTREPALPSVLATTDLDPELDSDLPEPAVVGTAALRRTTLPGVPSTLTCPECGGLLFEEEEAGLLHFRCHVGHAFSEETLMAVQATALEGALWAAVRALEEKAELGRRLAERAHARGWQSSAMRFEYAARDAEEGSTMIRDTLLNGPVRQALEAPVDGDEAEAAHEVAAPRISGPHGR